MEMLSNIIAILCVPFLLVYTWKILNWAWFRPKKLEKYLIENGLKGNPYKLLYGDLKELNKSVIEAQSKPINFSDDIAQKLIPFFLNAINKNENGLKGNSYKLLYGDLKELNKSVIEAQSKPINFSDDIAQKLIPFFLNAINKNENGLKENEYKLLYGDFKELKKSVIEAQSKPINFSDDIAQKLIPFFLNAINKNGGIPYKSAIPRPIWNPPLTRWGSLQPEYAAKVGVPESDTPHDT
ncbi:putative secologanin synthase-like [Capsicum annuum]|nr:putative secologanin synthase-like [Capsicum annuum]